MTRISLSDGRWFESTKSKRYKESTWHDGSNEISKATGSQWHHEWLYRTAGGAYVLNTWSAYQNIPETYEIVEKEAAHSWLAENGHHDAIPADVVESLEI